MVSPSKISYFIYTTAVDSQIHRMIHYVRKFGTQG